MMLNKICVVVVALALAGAPISSLLAAAPPRHQGVAANL